MLLFLSNDGESFSYATYVYAQVFWVVMNVVTGMIYFEDYASMSWTAMFFFIIGIIITLFGVYFLTQRSTSPDTLDPSKSIDIEVVTAGMFPHHVVTFHKDDLYSRIIQIVLNRI
jgi:surface polysaccharide O-acyltransferase-like enzyme